MRGVGSRTCLEFQSYCNALCGLKQILNGILERQNVIVPPDKASVSCIIGGNEGFSETVGCHENESRRRKGRNSPGDITITGF